MRLSLTLAEIEKILQDSKLLPKGKRIVGISRMSISTGGFHIYLEDEVAEEQ